MKRLVLFKIIFILIFLDLIIFLIAFYNFVRKTSSVLGGKVLIAVFLTLFGRFLYIMIVGFPLAFLQAGISVVVHFEFYFNEQIIDIVVFGFRVDYFFFDLSFRGFYDSFIRLH